MLTVLYTNTNDRGSVPPKHYVLYIPIVYNMCKDIHEFFDPAEM